jgi:sugar lactone lactonase YvrE
MSQITLMLHKYCNLVSLLLLMSTLPCYGAIITTIAGNNIQGYQGDGGLAVAAQLNKPSKITIDKHGNLLIADTFNSAIRQINRYGIITTIAGTGTPGYRGDEGRATAAQLNFPNGIAVDSHGGIYVADTKNHVIRKIDPNGIITTFAGTGQPGYGGDHKTAGRAQFNQPTALVFDIKDNLYIADTGNSVVRKINSQGIITTVAGTGQEGMAGDGKLATRALLNRPEGLAVIGQKIYITDTENEVVRVVDETGIIRTLSGTGDSGINSDSTATSLAQFHHPSDIIADSHDNLYIVDSENFVIRKLDTLTDTISIIAGNRTQGYSGDNRAAIFAQLNTPQGITIDENDNLYISDSYNHTIRKISTRAVDSAIIQPRSQTYTTRVNQSPIQADFLVTDVLGNPLTAQTVYFFAPANNTMPKSATTDELGRVSTSVFYGTTGSYQLFAAVSTSYIATQMWIQVHAENPPPPPSQPVQPPPSPPAQPLPQVLTVQVSQGDNQRIPVQQTAEAIQFVIKNSKDDLIQGQKVTFSVMPNAVLSTESAVSDDQGVVTTQFKATEIVGKYQITAHLNETTTATAQLEVFQPESPKPEVKPVLPQTLSVSAGDAQIIEMGKPSAAIRFRLKDTNNQAMAGKTLTFSVQPQGQGITIPKPTTDENGEITIFFNAVNATGDYLITAQLTDSLLTAKTRITVFKPVPVVTAARLVALNLNQVVEVNNKLPVYFTVLDDSGQPLAGQTVLFNLSPTGNGLSNPQAVSDSNGQVSTVLNPTNKSDDYTLTANVINTAIRATSLIHTFMTDKPEPVELSIRTVSGQNQTVLWGQNSADIKFQITTLAGSPVVKRKVLFQLQPDQGKLAFTEAITDMAGYVTTRVNSTTSFGDYRVIATISDTDMTATVPLIVIDSHATLKVLGEIQPLGINTSSAPIRFIATYRNGQPAANQKVNFSLQPAGHGLSTTQATTDAQGQVTTTMNPTNLEGRYVVTATLDNVRAQAIIQITTQPQTEIITVTAGAEQHVLLGELSEIITFTVTDGTGQPLAGKRVNFTATPSGNNLITRSALTDADGRVSTRLDKNTKPNSYLITASTEQTTISTTVVLHPMVAAVMKQSHASAAATAPDSTKQANLGDTGFFSGVFINNQPQKTIPVSAATKIMVAIKSAHPGKKTNIYITAKKTSAATRARAAATDSEWLLVQDTEQPQTWQWQPWEGSLDSLQPTESNVYLAESVTQHEYPTEFPSEGEWAITIGYSPPVVDTETPPAVPETLITTAEDTTITVDNMPSLGDSLGVDQENNPVPTKSAFSGGISIENASYVREATTLRSRTVQVEGNVTVEPSHIGYLADIIVVIAYKENNGIETFYMMQNPNELIPWNGDKLSLLAFKSAVELPSMYPITLYTGNFPVTGELRFYFGYRLSNNTLIFTQNSINAKVDDEIQLPSLGSTMEFGKTRTTINSFFVGGVSQNGQTFAATAQLPQSQLIQVTGVINIAPEHVGQRAELLLVAGYTPPGASTPQFFMQDAQNTFQLWQDFNPETLVPKQVIETLEQQITITLYKGQLPVLGKVDFYFGYRLVADRSVFYPSVPIEVVTE